MIIGFILIFTTPLGATGIVSEDIFSLDECSAYRSQLEIERPLNTYDCVQVQRQ